MSVTLSMDKLKTFGALRASLIREKSHLLARVAEIDRALAEEGPVVDPVDADFKRSADRVFTKNAELFRSLAR